MNITHERIKFRLRAQGTSLAEIARSLSISKSVVSRVCDGKASSARIRQAIADALGDSIENLWAEEKSD